MNIVFMSMDTLPSTLWARDLYDQMHIRSDFRKWFPRMCQYGFIEGRDYEYMPRVRLQDEGGRTVQRCVKDYRITQDMAKKLCKLHHTAVGVVYRPQPFDRDVLLGLLHKKPPRRSSYEAQLSDSDSLVTTTQIAKEYGCGAKVFNRLLHLHGIQYRANNQWVLYAKHLEWDGQERIRYVLQRYMGADASDFVYEVVKHFLMEALSRIYRPGCKADEMLCLVGQQGAGKSTFFRFLALNDDWFSDDLKQLNDSKIYEHLRGHWIMEMSEMIAAISAKSNEEIKSFLTRQKDTYRNPYDKYEEDRKRQCIFAGSTNTRQFIPFDRTGARRFLPIAIDSSKAEKHILDDEKEARSYFDQLWAEVMEIYWSTENKSSLLKFSKEMEQEISEYRKQFTQEDTMAGMIQGWLDAYKGSHVCSVQIWKEAFDHFDREPKKFETNEICSIMDTQITGWKRAGVHRFSKEGYGRQRSWIREGAEEEGGNEPDKDGFTKLTKAEQLELPFDLPDREKG